jgi:hypothetical protein
MQLFLSLLLISLGMGIIVFASDLKMKWWNFVTLEAIIIGILFIVGLLSL